MGGRLLAGRQCPALERRDVLGQAAVRLLGLADPRAAGGDGRLAAIDLELELVERLGLRPAGADGVLEGRPLRDDTRFEGREARRRFRFRGECGRFRLAKARELRVESPGLRSETHRLFRVQLLAETAVSPGLRSLAPE